jgi:uncharacterized membrane protein
MGMSLTKIVCKYITALFTTVQFGIRSKPLLCLQTALVLITSVRYASLRRLRAYRTPIPNDRNRHI